jgi:hypothetical protein
MSAGFMKGFPEIRPFPKAGPPSKKKIEGRKHGKTRILTHTRED